MKNIRRILVAVKDVDAKAMPAVDKAVQLAQAFGAEIELFHAITIRMSIDAAYLHDDGLPGAERAVRTHYRNRLEALAGRLRERGIKANATTEWDFPAYEAIVRRAGRVKADLIVAECHAGRRLAPWLLHITDWELLRTSPLPVLLVKTSEPYRSPVVLAAIDPAHAFAKPARLDETIFRTADKFARALKGSVHAMHACNVTPIAMLEPLGMGMAAEELEERMHAKFARVLKGRVARNRQHFVRDVPLNAIPAVAAQTKASLLVMGAISRSGIRRAIIGNTAEHVLNRVPCDILVVKPVKFRTKVARTGRGMRLLGPLMQPTPY